MELEGSYLEVEILSPKGSIDRDVSRDGQISLTLLQILTFLNFSAKKYRF